MFSRAVQSEEEEEAEQRRQHSKHWSYHINNCYKSIDILSLHGINASQGIRYILVSLQGVKPWYRLRGQTINRQ